MAFIVASDRTNPPSTEDLDRLCLDHFARYKHPKEYRIVEDLPTNNYGKVVKRELREQLRAESGNRIQNDLS